LEKTGATPQKIKSLINKTEFHNKGGGSVMAQQLFYALCASQSLHAVSF
jgi:hypothetical protein